MDETDSPELYRAKHLIRQQEFVLCNGATLTMPMLAPIASELLSNAGITHGFFTRLGGVSNSLYASLNCGFSADEEASHVHENRSRVAVSLGAKEASLFSPRQAHTTTVLALDGPWCGETPIGDGVVTKTRGISLSVLGADCAPVLFADPGTQVIGACHAGWKGALGGILENTVAAMVAIGAQRTRTVACIGPAIQQDSYEVGPEFRQRLLDDTTSHQRFFVVGNGDRYQFDLPRFIEYRLVAAGIEAVERLAHDTCADQQRFFSFRRATLRGEASYGRQISAITLPLE